MSIPLTSRGGELKLSDLSQVEKLFGRSMSRSSVSKKSKGGEKRKMGSRKSSNQREDPNDLSTFRRKRSKDVGNLIPPSMASNTSSSRLRIKKRSIQHSRSKSKTGEKKLSKEYRSYSAH